MMDKKSLLEDAEPEHLEWLKMVLKDCESESDYVRINAMRMLGQYLGIIGSKKAAKGRQVDVRFS
jgi:hypothetical protein